MLGFRLCISLLLAISGWTTTVESSCSKGCDLALGSYYVWSGTNLTFIATVFNQSIQSIVNQNRLANANSVISGTRINLPFTCDCIRGEFLGHVFGYDVVSGDTYNRIATEYYANLTTVEFLQSTNSYPASNIPDTGRVNVTVNCSCGNPSVSKDYGLFVTYPLRAGESLESIAAETNLTADLLRRYNPGADFSAGSGLVYIPGRGEFVCFLHYKHKYLNYGKRI